MSIPLLLFLCQVPTPPPQRDAPPLNPEDLASIAGKVINRLTREPVKLADITLRSGDFAPENLKSSADGTFLIDQLRPGRYTVEARKNGYTIPRRKPGTPLEFIILEKGAKKTGHTIELLPQAAISGRVMDENGEAVANVSVVVEPVRSGNPGVMRPSQTNDKGDYRLFGLEPGKYRVRVTPPPQTNFEMPNRSTKPARMKPAESPGPSEGLVPVYFPSATIAEQAGVLELAAGDERQGIDIQMVKARVFEISGKVVPPPGWTPENPNRPMMGNVYLVSTRRMQFNMGGSAMVDNSGRFTVKNVAPGAYYLMANLSGARTSARTRIDVVGGDVNNVELQFHAPVSLTGTVKMPDRMDPSKLRLMLNSTDMMGGGMAQCMVDAKGAFKLENVTPDIMALRVVGLEPSLYVQSVQIDGKDVEVDAIPIRGGEGGQLEVTIASNGGSVEGVVRMANDVEQEGAAVVLWPDVDTGEPTRASQVRVTRSGSKGKFQIQGVRPGKYLIAAFDNIQVQGPTGNPDEEALRAARSKASSLQLNSGSKLTQDLKSLGEPE